MMRRLHLLSVFVREDATDSLRDFGARGDTELKNGKNADCRNRRLPQLRHALHPTACPCVASQRATLNSLYNALRANRVLIAFTPAVYQVVHITPANSASCSVSAIRAFSRLSHVWLTFKRTGPG